MRMMGLTGMSFLEHCQVPPDRVMAEAAAGIVGTLDHINGMHTSFGLPGTALAEAAAGIFDAADQLHGAAASFGLPGTALSQAAAGIFDAVNELNGAAASFALPGTALAEIIKVLSDSPHGPFWEYTRLGFTEYGSPDFAVADSANSTVADPVDTSNIKESKKLSDQELAIWLTIITCLLVNTSLLAINRISRLAPDMAAEGINPYEGATAFYPIIYYVWLAYLNRSSRS